MKTAIIAAALIGVAAMPAFAQGSGEDVSEMSCGSFLALDEEAQMSAMLDLRAAYTGEDVPAAEEAQAATKVTGATETGAQSGTGGEPVEAEARLITAQMHQRLSGLRTSCMDVPDVPAIDALVAAHADYDPEVETAAAQ